MNAFVRALLLTLSILLSLPAQAHSAEEIPLDPVSTVELRELMDEAHHALEQEDLTYWEQVKEKANLKKFVLNAYRWRSSHKDRPEVANASANIILLLSTSHLIETVGGVAMASVGVAHGLDSTMDKIMTTVGMIIPIPGLDPMCIALFGTYMKWPQASNRFLTKPRALLLRGAAAANAMAGLPNGWLSAAYSEISKQKFLQRYRAGGARYTHHWVFDDVRFQIYGTEPGQSVELNMSRQPDGAFALASVRLSAAATSIGRSEFKKLLTPFGANIKDFVFEIANVINENKLNSLRHLGYVERVDELPWSKTVFVKAGAFPFHKLHASDLPCETLLTASAEQ